MLRCHIHPNMTLQLGDALIQNNADADVLPLSNRNHDSAGSRMSAVARGIIRTVLLGTEPPRYRIRGRRSERRPKSAQVKQRLGHEGLLLQLADPQTAVEVGEEHVPLPRHGVHHERRVCGICVGIERLEHGDLATLIGKIAE